MKAAGISDSVRIQDDAGACPECGSTLRVARGLCLNCLLRRGLGPDTESAETLDQVLEKIDVRDADWRVGNYQILEEIGRGGMGVIYRARQRHSRRIVALKRVLGFHADSRETLARFRREAEAAASLDHPNILPIYEVSESEDGLPFFSMKFAAGGSLLDSASSLRGDPRQIVRLMAKVTRAVQYAHSQGILHRDIKPGNILLDGRGEPLVSDFGLAKWLDTSSDLTRTLTIFGTPGYIAPEQAQGPAKNLRPTADIYSVGAVLFDLFTGRPPFLGEHALAVIKQASEKPAPKLRSLASSADRDLETICARCLEREPTARYHSADALAEDLECWLEGRPIIARPVSPATRTWRWSKRNPKLASSVATAAILGAIGLVAVFTSSHLSSVIQTAELTRHSIAVFPFEDLDDLSTSSSAARAVTKAFLPALKQAKGIRATAVATRADDPWSQQDWKKVGEAADTRYVVSGTVRARNGKRRVTLRLIETGSGSVVSTWLEDVDPSEGIGQLSISRVSRILGLNSSSTAPDSLAAADGDINAIGDSSNPSARSYYARGRDLFFRYNLADQKRAIESLEKALQLDPNYAQAHALLASACQARAAIDPDEKWLREAETSAATALRLAPLLPEAHRSVAGNLRLKGQLKASIDSYLTAYELDPSSARAAATLGNVYDFLGRPDLAIGWFQKATRRETRPLYADNLGEAWADLGEYDRAEEAFKVASVFRSDLPTGTLGLCKIALLRGDVEGARRECESARTRYKDNPQPIMMAAIVEFFNHHFAEAEKWYQQAIVFDRAGGVEFYGSVRFLSAVGLIRQLAGDKVQGKALLGEARALDEKELSVAPDNPNRIYSLAATYAAMGSSEEANAKLTQAIAAGWIDYHSLMLDPRWDAIRDSQPFKETLSRLTEKVEEMRRQQSGRKLTSTLN